MPLLFRVDQEIGLAGGRRNVADCGARGECYDLTTPALVCLRQLAGVERLVPVRGAEIPNAGRHVTGSPTTAAAAEDVPGRLRQLAGHRGVNRSSLVAAR